jgi:branched-subunit amino acid ABC-type transport system permease component
MVYGVIRLINFAHGDLLMVAAYIAFFGIVMFHLPWPVVIVISVALTGLLGILIDRGAYKPLRRSPRISALITAIGVSFLLENLGLVLIGGRPKTFPTQVKTSSGWGSRIPILSLWILLLRQCFWSSCFLWLQDQNEWPCGPICDMETVRLMMLTQIEYFFTLFFVLHWPLRAGSCGAYYPALGPSWE